MRVVDAVNEVKLLWEGAPYYPTIVFIISGVHACVHARVRVCLF